MYIFGKDIEYSLFAYEDGVAIASIPAQSYTAYIFTDQNQPSREEAIAGTGALATINATHTSGGTLTFTIPAISDPNPNAVTQTYSYWVAVNFVLKTAGQTQTIVRDLRISRASAQDRAIGVTTSKIVSIYPEIYSYLNQAQVEAMISISQENLVNDLRNKGFEWAKIYRADQLFTTLLFKSLEMIYLSQVNRQGDKFLVLAESAKESYMKAINNLQLSFDESQTGQETSKVNAGGGVFFGVR